jgi:hypothetical protein
VTDPTASDTFGGRYVFAKLEQRQLTMTTRLTVILTPRVSVQMYTQPLLAVGNYLNFKELARPRSFDFREYSRSDALIAYDAAARAYSVDPDRDGPAGTFTFDDPDFNFKSLRVNTVFRWELKPGSTFYAVWTRQQENRANPGEFDLRRDWPALFSAPGDDVVLVKIAYWIGR